VRIGAFGVKEPIPELNEPYLFAILRPSVCRLFGFTVMKNKDGKPELMTCRLQKKENPFSVKVAQKAISSGMYVPSYDYFFLQIGTLQHSLGRQRLPVNQAFQFALDRYGLTIQLMEGNGPRQRDWERRLFDNLKTAILGKSKQSLIAPLKKG